MKLQKQTPDSELVFLDGSAYHSNDVNNKVLHPLNSENQIKINKTIGSGNRFNVINAISLNEFVRKAEYIVKNDTINAKKFEKWAED